MCHASDFSHIKKGRYGKISLDDLNLAMVGNLVDGTADRLFATLYLDQRATREQSDALFQIVQYMNTLANQPPVPFRSVKSVPIAFYESTNRTEYHVEIRNTLHEKALPRRGKSGRPLFSLAAMDLWSNTVHNADNVEFKYEDAVERERWDYSRHYANLKYFSVSKQMYVDEKMLGQHGNNSGKWTPRQLEIIHKDWRKRSLRRPINQADHRAHNHQFNEVRDGLLYREFPGDLSSQSGTGHPFRLLFTHVPVELGAKAFLRRCDLPHFVDCYLEFAATGCADGDHWDHAHPFGDPDVALDHAGSFAWGVCHRIRGGGR